MNFNHKDARILKLLAKGLTVEQVMRKAGLSGEAGRKRVQDAIDRSH